MTQKLNGVIKYIKYNKLIIKIHLHFIFFIFTFKSNIIHFKSQNIYLYIFFPRDASIIFILNSRLSYLTEGFFYFILYSPRNIIITSSVLIKLGEQIIIIIFSKYNIMCIG